jgi:hypothetical protein
MLLPTRTKEQAEDMGGFELATLGGAQDERKLEETAPLSSTKQNRAPIYGGGMAGIYGDKGGDDEGIYSSLGGDTYGIYDDGDEDSWATTPTTTADDISGFFKKSDSGATADDEI